MDEDTEVPTDTDDADGKSDESKSDIEGSHVAMVVAVTRARTVLAKAMVAATRVSIQTYPDRHHNLRIVTARVDATKMGTRAARRKSFGI